ncbi:MAG: LysM peptidoglycan-binding domain-containing protein [Francisella sp.]
MLKRIHKKFLLIIALAITGQSYSMEIYTVKSNDYLYKIAKNHAIDGVSVSDLTDAIKGINKSEIPGIVDNRIGVGDKLAIPTTKDEVEDGLTLMRNQILQNSYNNNSNNMSSQSSNLSNNSNVANISSQDKVPVIIPADNNSPETYKSNFANQISSSDVQDSEYYDKQSTQSASFLGSLFKFIVYVFILGLLIIFAKRFWENRALKREQELELISKRKRDHLMSRISPVVSDSDFYKPEEDKNNLQQEFDFSEILQQDSASSDNEKVVLNDESESTLQQDIQNEEDFFENNREKKIIIKTEKGVAFDVKQDNAVFMSSSEDNKVEEIDLQQKEEQEFRFLNELIENFLESQKYAEAIITIQDSLEKYPNNVDLRYKLLEVYARAGDEIAFEGEVHFIKSKSLVSMFDPLHQKIAKLRERYFE